ncbi:hypothetical protein GJ496_001686 [Pomphorhynchus laevis]|nr:hypothetical protein GJ496_001686 [Pomphorhynchus laevis]
MDIDLRKLVSVCTDGAPSMVGKEFGAVTLLEKMNNSLLRYHCIIHQEESLCGKTLNMQHVMSHVIKCVNKIKTIGLEQQEFKDYCNLSELEYRDLFSFFVCEVQWLSRGRCLSRFWKLENAIYDFLKNNNELPSERDLLINDNWLFDFSFLVDISSHLNELNLRLQDKTCNFLV